MNTALAREVGESSVHLEQVFSHPGMSFDEEKGLLEMDGEAKAALVQLIEETKKSIPTGARPPVEVTLIEATSVEVAPVETVSSLDALPSLIDQGITTEALSITKKGNVRGAIGKIFDHWEKRKHISARQIEKIKKKVTKKVADKATEKVTEKAGEKAREEIGPSVPSVNIWIRIGDRMLPAPIMIWSGSTFESVRVGLEVRLRYSGIFAKKK